MISFIRMAALCSILAILSTFLGCSNKEEVNWLIGEWTFSREMTLNNLPPEANTEVGSQLVKLAISQAEGSKLRITETEATLTAPNGVSTSFGYSILQRPDDNTLAITVDDGKVITFTRSGEFVAMPSTGDLQWKSYFKREP
jgi:hypothetical protein